VETALQMLPDTGQFLGRLCGSLVVRGSPELYKIVISCVMALYKQNSTTPLEIRAKNWAVVMYSDRRFYKTGTVKTEATL